MSNNLKTKVLFATFRIYNEQDEFLGIASGNIERIHREWAPRGGVKFMYDINHFQLVDTSNWNE